MNDKTGGPAFPIQSIDTEFPPVNTGMTMRDYFAAKAMQGMLASGRDLSWGSLAYSAYGAADKMLEERKCS